MPDAAPEVELLRAEVERLRARVSTLRDGRDDLSYVFVMTYGRSGSTLLMGLLNTLPGYLVRGENDDAMRFLYDFHRTCVARSTFWPIERMRMRSNPFFGMGDYPVAASVAGIRRLALDTLLRPKPDTRVTGFKEIRWWKRDLVEPLEFTRTVFPGARFVLNTRDVEDVIQSKWWARKDPAEARAQVQEYDARIERAHRELGDATYRVHYDDYVADPGVLAGMYAWLGEAFDRARVDEVMGTPHSY